MSHMNESCHMWMSHVTCEWVMSHVNESCHIWMSHVTYGWVMSHMNESCHTWRSHVSWMSLNESPSNVNEWMCHPLMQIIQLVILACPLRSTQSIIYVPLLVSVFHKSILLVVQHKYLKCWSKDFTLQNLILRTIVYGTGCIPQHYWVVDFHLINMIRQKCLVPGLYQLQKGKSVGLALQYFYMFHRVRRYANTSCSYMWMSLDDKFSAVNEWMRHPLMHMTQWVNELFSYVLLCE